MDQTHDAFWSEVCERSVYRQKAVPNFLLAAKQFDFRPHERIELLAKSVISCMGSSNIVENSFQTARRSEGLALTKLAH